MRDQHHAPEPGAGAEAGPRPRRLRRVLGWLPDVVVVLLVVAAGANLQLDLGYQYLSAPDAEIAEVRDFTSYPIHKGIDAHQIKVGLRYDLW